MHNSNKNLGDFHLNFYYYKHFYYIDGSRENERQMEGLAI